MSASSEAPDESSERRVRKKTWYLLVAAASVLLVMVVLRSTSIPGPLRVLFEQSCIPSNLMGNTSWRVNTDSLCLDPTNCRSGDLESSSSPFVVSTIDQISWKAFCELRRHDSPYRNVVTKVCSGCKVCTSRMHRKQRSYPGKRGHTVQ